MGGRYLSQPSLVDDDEGEEVKSMISGLNDMIEGVEYGIIEKLGFERDLGEDDADKCELSPFYRKSQSIPVINAYRVEK